MKMKSIDINCDVGENPKALQDGSEEKIISLISSANIACGGHAGDEDSILKVMRLCKKYDVGIGAHPSYPDKNNFGRIELKMSPDEISKFVSEQIKFFVGIAARNGFEVNHIKPHGALYNAAAKNKIIALAIAKGIAPVSKKFILYGLSGSIMIDIWRSEGFAVASEAFADRKYKDDGSLRSRKFSDALFTDPEDAVLQAINIAEKEKIVSVNGAELKINADTICVHSDTPNSLEILSEIRKNFNEAHIDIARVKSLNK